MYLIGFRNKLVVFNNWIWNYFTYDRGIRLIIRPFDKEEKKKQREAEISGLV
jgi:NADH:ubiquinone reductase (H+-translocating)